MEGVYLYQVMAPCQQSSLWEATVLRQGCAGSRGHVERTRRLQRGLCPGWKYSKELGLQGLWGPVTPPAGRERPQGILGIPFTETLRSGEIEPFEWRRPSWVVVGGGEEGSCLLPDYLFVFHHGIKSMQVYMYTYITYMHVHKIRSCISVYRHKRGKAVHEIRTLLSGFSRWLKRWL